jgi:MFS family permease
MQVIQMKWLKWRPRPMILLGSLFLMGSMVLFLVSTQLSIYYFSFFLFGMGSGLMMPGFMAGASLSVSKEQQGGAAGLVAAIQGISAVITPLLTTTLYQVDKHIPFMLVALLVVVMGTVMLGMKTNQPSSVTG